MKEVAKDPVGGTVPCTMQHKSFATDVNWARVEGIIRMAIRDACRHEGAPCWLCVDVAAASAPNVRNVLLQQGVMEIGPVSDEYLNGTGPA